MLRLPTSHDARVLPDAGHTRESLAEHAGVSLATGPPVQREGAVADVHDAAGRPGQRRQTVEHDQQRPRWRQEQVHPAK